MSKIFLLGDTHIGLGYPNKEEKWLKVHRQYFSEFLIPILKEKVNKGDIIIHLGDFFDNRDIIPINLLNYGMDIVEEISKIAPLHMLVGNHDCWSKSSDEINTIRPYKYIPNVFIYDKTSILEYNGLNLLMMPYIDKKLEQIKLINKNRNCDYLFCHSDLNGARMHLTSIAHRNSDKIDIEEFTPFKGVYSGHIHIVDRHKNFTFVGSNFQMDRNDYGDQKGIFIIDTSTGEEEFIPNMISPVFKKVKINKEDDIEKLEELKDSNDYIDIEISNRLLVSNRKLRRKLEILLERKNFSSIEYIDDITNELTEDNIEPVKESLNESDISEISLNLDYEEYIKEYILKQKYESDKFRDGVILEYSEIIRIFKENFKNYQDD